ncbi:MAG: hypothetical protein INR73_26500 [Williamsia sp.]|nr:hypothetical protein [Williamsia sp.]
MSTPANTKIRSGENTVGSSPVCTPGCEAEDQAFTCKLTAAELRERKILVLASLKKQVLKKRALKNGFAYKFAGSDAMVDELVTFIKTERTCCDFFTFQLSISGDKRESWLKITGPEGAKDFISHELEL